MKRKFTHLTLTIAFILITAISFSQTAGDFRSAATGNWSSLGTWETYDGAVWNPAVATPTSASGVISIRSTHTVTVNAAISADQLVVDAGGTLNINSFGNNLTLDDGAGDDLVVNGTMLLRALNTLNSSGPGVTVVINGIFNWFSGTLQAPTTVSGTGIINWDLEFDKNLNRNLINNGTINWISTTANGNVQFGTGGVTLTNNGTINELFQKNTGFFNALSASFVNTGIVNKTTTFALANTGVITNNSGTFQGVGTYNFSAFSVTNTGTIAPGTSPGLLTISPATIAGTSANYIAEILDGTGSGTGNDQLTINGAIDMTGVTITVTELSPFTAPLGVYTILNSTGALTGTPTYNLPSNYQVVLAPPANTIQVQKIALFPLPAKWGDFNAISKNNNKVELNWSTLQETNVSNYTIEYSSNGIDFNPIGVVNANGTTNDISEYSFIHMNPDIQKTNYYRIRQTDFDGKNAISIVRPVRFNKGNVVPIVVFPNPVKDRLQLSIQTENTRVQMINLNGRVVRDQVLQPGNHEWSVSNLAAGMYKLLVTSSNERMETISIIKQ